MSNDLIVQAFMRDSGSQLSSPKIEHLKTLHSEAYMSHMQQVRPLPGAKQLLKALTQFGVRYAIATSSKRDHAEPS